MELDIKLQSVIEKLRMSLDNIEANTVYGINRDYCTPIHEASSILNEIMRSRITKKKIGKFENTLFDLILSDLEGIDANDVEEQLCSKSIGGLIHAARELSQ